MVGTKKEEDEEKRKKPSHLGSQVRLPLRQAGAGDPLAVASEQRGAGEHAALAGLRGRGLGGSGRRGHERLDFD